MHKYNTLGEKMIKIAKMNQGKVINIEVASEDWIEQQEDTSEILIYTDENPAAIGGDYVDGYFYNIQPFPSWLRDTGSWIPPVEYPNDEKFYTWNEETISWVEIE